MCYAYKREPPGVGAAGGPTFGKHQDRWGYAGLDLAVEKRTGRTADSKETRALDDEITKNAELLRFGS